MRGQKRRNRKCYKEIMAKNVSNLKKTINPQIQEAQLTLSTRHMKKTKPSNIICKLLKASGTEKNLNITKEKRHVVFRETKIKLKIYFTIAIM